ncbi:hypothetical protein GCM10007880_63090 [Mesorhizobium amorphae]|nr:hypothetical protein GCM10007880_63090 [Mesorhizobium amorphae]
MNIVSQVWLMAGLHILVPLAKTGVKAVTLAARGGWGVRQGQPPIQTSLSNR